MPFTSGVFSRIWTFVDQFVSGEDANRSDFDLAFDDVFASMQDGYDDVQGNIASLTSNLAIKNPVMVATSSNIEVVAEIQTSR